MTPIRFVVAALLISSTSACGQGLGHGIDLLEQHFSSNGYAWVYAIDERDDLDVWEWTRDPLLLGFDRAIVAEDGAAKAECRVKSIGDVYSEDVVYPDEIVYREDYVPKPEPLIVESESAVKLRVDGNTTANNNGRCGYAEAEGDVSQITTVMIRVNHRQPIPDHKLILVGTYHLSQAGAAGSGVRGSGVDVSLGQDGILDVRSAPGQRLFEGHAWHAPFGVPGSFMGSFSMLVNSGDEFTFNVSTGATCPTVIWSIQEQRRVESTATGKLYLRVLEVHDENIIRSDTVCTRFLPDGNTEEYNSSSEAAGSGDRGGIDGQ